MLTSSQIDALSVEDAPLGHGIAGTYKRTKRYSEFIPTALMQIQTFVEANLSELCMDESAPFAERFDDYLYQLCFNDETFKIAPALEIAYVLYARDKVADMTSDMSEISDHTDGRNRFGFDLNELESDLIEDLRDAYKKQVTAKA